MMQAVWIVGCGDVGMRVAERLQREGREPTGVVRSEQSVERLHVAGLRAMQCDLDTQAPPLEGTVIWLAPPPREGAQEPRLARCLAACPGIDRLLYLSTSGVYGDSGGEWIDESAPIAPKSARGQRRADAERQLAAWRSETGGDYVVIRVPGIYGPGRLPLQRLQEGTPVITADRAPYTNRIHVDDLAAATVCVLRSGESGTAYNVADGNPTTMTDYFLRCAALLELPAPPQLPPEEARAHMSAAMWSFMEESKRLRVDRLRDELGFRWQYPDLASGLPACLPSESTKDV
ncbi:SDR family oxidoreductase [Algiphilus sp.]|uniref:SDR family oxidoreductase n=1 Tax=Algiphilus sp. TaxID=1872431 RepID=UPI002A64D639|nr:SDR family oxidoreductase [Pseudomonadota bacterium]